MVYRASLLRKWGLRPRRFESSRLREYKIAPNGAYFIRGDEVKRGTFYVRIRKAFASDYERSDIICPKGILLV